MKNFPAGFSPFFVCSDILEFEQVLSTVNYFRKSSILDV